MFSHYAHVHSPRECNVHGLNTTNIIIPSYIQNDISNISNGGSGINCIHYGNIIIDNDNTDCQFQYSEESESSDDGHVDSGDEDNDGHSDSG